MYLDSDWENRPYMKESDDWSDFLEENVQDGVSIADSVIIACFK